MYDFLPTVAVMVHFSLSPLFSPPLIPFTSPSDVTLIASGFEEVHIGFTFGFVNFNCTVCHSHIIGSASFSPYANISLHTILTPPHMITLHVYFFPQTLAYILHVFSVVPPSIPVTMPLDDTVATFLFEDDHFTFYFVPVTLSLNVSPS